MELKPPFRHGRIEDAALLSRLVNYAGEGLPLYLWGKMASEGQIAWDVGKERAGREEGSFSYRNAMMLEYEGSAVGSLIGYAIPEEIEPIPDDMPPMFRPLQELENMVPGSWYVNVLAVLLDYRSRGLGSHLLNLAELMAADGGHSQMSIIVSDGNHGACQLYARHSYQEAATRKIIKEDWINDGENWVLLTKQL